MLAIELAIAKFVALLIEIWMIIHTLLLDF